MLFIRVYNKSVSLMYKGKLHTVRGNDYGYYLTLGKKLAYFKMPYDPKPLLYINSNKESMDEANSFPNTKPALDIKVFEAYTQDFPDAITFEDEFSIVTDQNHFTEWLIHVLNNTFPSKGDN